MTGDKVMNTRIRVHHARSRTAALLAAALAAMTLTAVPAFAQAGSSDPANATGTPAPASQSSASLSANAQKLSDGEGLTPAQQTAVGQAVAEARESGKPVAISALTTETWQISAEPSGGLSFAANTLPVRTVEHGRWEPVDTSLVKNANGGFSPVATAYAHVTFSGGGTAPLATSTTATGATYQLSWPGPLPVPTVSGNTATYADVLSGVDLAVSANSSGAFSEVLIIRDAKAAANPRLDRLALAVRTTGTGTQRGALATAPGGLSLVASGASMWDSNTTLAATTVKSAHAAAKAPTLAQVAASEPSSADQPGYAAHVGSLGLSASSSSLTLVPDPALLRGKNTVFPVYEDPTLVWHIISQGSPAYDEVKQDSPCNSQSYYDDTAMDDNSLGVGWTNTYCGGVQRTYYQWKIPSVMWGAHINAAAVNAVENWQASFSCSYSRTVDLHWTGGIGSGTYYSNQPGYLTGSQAYSTSTSVGAAYNPSGCTNPATASAGFNVQTPMQWTANHNGGQFTVALDQDGDTNYADFDRFQDNPTLNIEYDHNPNTPGASQLSATAGGTDNAGCATAAPYPFIGKALASNPAELNARDLTSPDGDQLQATFKYWVAGSSTSYTGLSANDLGNGSTARYSLPGSFISSLTDGQNVDWQVQTSNGTYSSNWSPTCTFTAEPTAPLAPVIGANALYPNVGPDSGGGTGAPAGTSSVFQISQNTGNGAVTSKYYYELDRQPSTTGTVPASETATPSGSSAADPADTWALNATSGSTAADSAGTYPATLQSGATWADDSTRHQVLATNGTSTGNAATSGQVLDTAADFSVSEWVKLTSIPTGFQTALSQDGTVNSGFYLQYDATDKAWAFAAASADTGNPTTYRAHATTTPAAGTWYQLTGVYTRSSGLLQLYVDGMLVGTATDPTEFATTGALAIGRSIYNGGHTDFFNGQISDVQVYSRALTTAEASAMYSANVTITPLSAGPHTLYVNAVDAAGDVSGTAAYQFIAAGHAAHVCGSSLQACYDNTAISPDASPSEANADGGSDSISATDLANAGWISGGTVTVDGATLQLPAFGTGKADNVLAANQTITCTTTATLDCAVPATGASSLMFLATATDGTMSNTPPPADTTAPYVPAGTGVAGTYSYNGTVADSPGAPIGSIDYAGADTPANYDLTVPDWQKGPSSLATLVLPHTNNPTKQQTTATKLYTFTVPLTPGQTIQSIVLPDLTSGPGEPALHIFAIATRNTTLGTAEANGGDVATTGSNTWTGAWASDTEGNYNYETGTSNFSNQSFRVLLQPSVTGSTVRIKLDDALGTSPIDLGEVTVATTNGNAITPTPATSAAPVPLTFGGSQKTTIPEGGMVYSDPLSFSVTASQWLAVSFQITNSIPDLVQHSWATDSYEYVAPIASGNQTTEQSGSEYTASGALNGTFTDLVTGLDVQTAGMSTQIVLGDNLIDAWQPNTAPLSPNDGNAQRLSDDIANASSTTPDPYGTVNAGIESNQLLKDSPETNAGAGVGGPSALARIDRDVLDEPGISTVIINEGLEDALAGTSASALEGDSSSGTSDDGYAALLTYVSDTATSSSTFVNSVAVGLTPCDTYAGDGATTGNDPCTSAVDGVRTDVNTWLGDTPDNLAAWTPAALYYIDPDETIGVPDSSNGETKLAPLAMVGTSRSNTPSDPVNLTNSGTATLANAILAAQDIWPLGDGSGSTTASDSSQGTHNSYLNSSLPSDSNLGNNPLTLSGTYSWATGATVGSMTGQTVLSLDGTTGYGETGNTAVLNTAGSFSISAWANLSKIPTGYGTVAAEAGTQASGFYLQYNPNAKSWCMNFMTSDTANTTGAGSVPCATAAPTANTWYHLVGTYNAATKTAALYVNGTLAGTATGITTWAATGAMLIGADQYNAGIGDYLPGEISDVQAFNYTLTAPQVAGLYQQIGELSAATN